MANTRLFDSWQIGMDLPAPFDRAIDGGVRYSTKEEDCSCYNKATRGKKATLFPVVLRAVLNLMRGGLNDGNIAAFYCMEYTKAYQGKEMDCVIIYNPKNGRFKEGIIATPELGTAFSMEMIFTLQNRSNFHYPSSFPKNLIGDYILMIMWKNT